MKQRLLLSASIFICVLFMLFMSCATGQIRDWKSQRIETLERNSRLDETSVGPVEYAVFGDGIPVLFVHGSMAGYDSGFAFEPLITGLGVQLICPSRPGYLRTPLSIGETAEEQAEVFAALLDELGIDRVAVAGGSGGGPASLYFALKYPERTIALLLVSTIIQQVRPISGFTPAQRRQMENTMKDRSSFRMYRILSRNPERAIALMFPDTSKRIHRDIEKIELAVRFMEASLPMSLREEGTYNDLTEKNSFPLELLGDIRVPTFIAHGAKDQWAPLEMAEKAGELIPNAELTVFAGDHIFFIAQREEFREYLEGILF